jgi:hypothetical protein
MRTPAALLDTLRKTLGAYARSGRPESQTSLADLLLQMEQAETLKELGCQEKDCRLCAWGRPEAKDWENQCRLWAFAETAQDAAYAGRKGNASVQKEARDLLAALEASPLPGRKK